MEEWQVDRVIFTELYRAEAGLTFEELCSQPDLADVAPEQVGDYLIGLVKCGALWWRRDTVGERKLRFGLTPGERKVLQEDFHGWQRDPC